MALPDVWGMVPVRGRYITTRGVAITGRITFTPRIARLVYASGKVSMIAAPTTVGLVDGAFEVFLPATDDPDIIGGPFTYRVKEDFAGGQTYDVEIPVSKIDDGIDLSTVAPVAPNSAAALPGITRLEYVRDVKGLVDDISALRLDFENEPDYVTDDELADALEAIPAPDLSAYVTNTALSNALDALPDFPSLEPYVTDDELATALGALPEPDFTPYATKTDLSAAIDAIPDVDLTPYVTDDQLADALNALPEFPDLTPYVTDDELAARLETDLSSLRSHVARTDNPHAVTKAQVGLSNVNNTSDAQKPVTAAQAATLALKADLVNGQVPTSQIPAVALTTGRVVADRSALLALSDVQPGDIAVISSGVDKGTYLLTESGPPSTFTSWLPLSAPTDVVQSVNGQVATVVLGAADVGALGAALNLSDVPSPSTARSNLGLGTAATQSTTAFDLAGTAVGERAGNRNRTNHTGNQSADTVFESGSKKWLTTTERAQIAAIAGDISAASTEDRKRANHTGQMSAEFVDETAIRKWLTDVERGKIAGLSKANIFRYLDDGTFEAPAGGSVYDVVVIAAGGGAGGGAVTLISAGVSASPGGGGAGGGVSRFRFNANTVPSSIPITVGKGGAGGLGTSRTTSGNAAVAGDGVNGGDSSFGNLLIARGGGRGGRGLVGANAGSGAGGQAQEAGTNGGAGNQAGTNAGGTSYAGAAGGASGGGVNTGGGHTGAQAGGVQAVFPAAVPGLGGISTDRTGKDGGNQAFAAPGPGGGGGFPGADVNGTAGNGGKGGLYGGGGAGGGSARTDGTAPATSGNGGAGGDGIVTVVVYF